MVTPNDLETNRGVRRILVKHWIDLGRLSVRTINGNVVLYGRLQRLTGSQGDLTSPILDAIFHEMKRVNGARRVTAHFENWSNDQGFWRELSETAQHSAILSETEDAPASNG